MKWLKCGCISKETIKCTDNTIYFINSEYETFKFKMERYKTNTQSMCIYTNRSNILSRSKQLSKKGIFYIPGVRFGDLP